MKTQTSKLQRKSSERSTTKLCFNVVSDFSMQLLYSSGKIELCGLKLHKKHSFRLDYSKL